jgi:NAD(P)-dependent dehydrogenase (short-subunit alcohol dehydrogenase family)
MMTDDFKDKVVLVTGAGSGIGREAATSSVKCSSSTAE